MRIAIIGSGQVGTALATALRRGGHEIVFGVRSPDPRNEAEVALAQAALSADAVILAIPFAAAGAVIAAASGFKGKIVIDASNPLGMGKAGQGGDGHGGDGLGGGDLVAGDLGGGDLGGGDLGLTLGFDRSGAEEIQAMAPEARVFKTFNQTGFENLADAGRYGVRPVMFVAGDDRAAKPLVLQLVDDAGFDAIDLGGLRRARLLEPLAMIWIELARKGGFGPDIAFSLQRKV